MENQHAATLKIILDNLSDGVPEAEASFDKITGRFLAPNGGWAVTNQDQIFPLALLLKTPGTKYYQNPRIRELALQGGDALRNWQDADGLFEFIKIDGSRWGKIYMPWSMYHWLETYELLKNDMPEQQRTRWRQGLTLTFDGVVPELVPDRNVHNIPAWYAMTLVRAGQLFKNAVWLDTGTNYIRRVAAAQQPEGFWAEGFGPTTLYNLVYQHALGLYYHFTNDRVVLPSLKRALDFHLHFTYPDGTLVETVDGRVKYRKQVNVTGCPGFSLFPEGRTFVNFLLKNLNQSQSTIPLIPHLASAWQHFPAGDFAEIPQQKTDFVSNYHDKALVRKRGPWFLCFSGYVAPNARRAENARQRFIMDRQNYFSLFRKPEGLLIGGGNSKHQPEFCTFEYWKNGGIFFEADTVSLEVEGNQNRLQARYGEDVFELAVEIQDQRQIKISFRSLNVLGDDVSVWARFQMRLNPGTTLSRRGGNAPQKIDPLTNFQIFRDSSKNELVIVSENWQLEMPPNSRFEWPAYPFNPYAIDGAAPAENAVATVSVDLKGAKMPAEFFLSIQKKPGS